MARCDDITGNSSTVISCGVFVRRDCRRVVLYQDTAGTVTLSLGATGGIAGFPCAGPIPSWQDFEIEPGDQLVYVQAWTPYNSADCAYAVVEEGHTYQFDCFGIWARDPDNQYKTDADGEDGSLHGSVLQGPFQTWNYGLVVGRDPGNANSIETQAGWMQIGKSNKITASADGNFKIAFCDDNNPPTPPDGYYYENNVGYMAVRVRDIT